MFSPCASKRRHKKIDVLRDQFTRLILESHPIRYRTRNTVRNRYNRWFARATNPVRRTNEIFDLLYRTCIVPYCTVRFRTVPYGKVLYPTTVRYGTSVRYVRTILYLVRHGMVPYFGTVYRTVRPYGTVTVE